MLGPFVPINRCSRHFRDHQGSGITEDSVWRVGLRQLPVPLAYWCENRVLKWLDTWSYLETSLVAWFVHPSCCAVDTSKCSYGLDLCFVVGKQKTLVLRWVEVLIQSAVVQFCHTGVTEFTLVAEHSHVARGSRGWWFNHLGNTVLTKVFFADSFGDATKSCYNGTGGY